MDLNCDLNQWFKSHWFKSVNPDDDGNDDDDNYDNADDEDDDNYFSWPLNRDSAAHAGVFHLYIV